MGWKYEVYAWVRPDEDSHYRDEMQYCGQSLLKALIAFAGAKKKSGCVKFIWRG